MIFTIHLVVPASYCRGSIWPKGRCFDFRVMQKPQFDPPGFRLKGRLSNSDNDSWHSEASWTPVLLVQKWNYILGFTPILVVYSTSYVQEIDCNSTVACVFFRRVAIHPDLFDTLLVNTNRHNFFFWLQTDSIFLWLAILFWCQKNLEKKKKSWNCLMDKNAAQHYKFIYSSVICFC